MLSYPAPCLSSGILAQDGAQMATNESHVALRWPLLAPDGPKLPQGGSRWPPEGPKEAPRRPNDAPTWPQVGQKLLQNGSEMGKAGACSRKLLPRCPQEAKTRVFPTFSSSFPPPAEPTTWIASERKAPQQETLIT